MASAWEIKGKGAIEKFDKLESDVKADVCVIGGGLAGLWSAYLLAHEGKSVVVVEMDELGRGATLYTTGFITQVIDTDLSDLVRMFGESSARLAWTAGKEAIEQIAALVKEEEIDCEFVRLPMTSYARAESELEKLKKEAEIAKRLGFKVEVIPEQIPGFKNSGAVAYLDQAKYHPMKFFKALVEGAKKLGVKIYEHTEVVEVNNGEVLTKDKFSISAKDVVLATYEPLNNPKATHWKKGMYETYVYELEIDKGRLEEGMYEDQRNPYHYFRIDDLPGGKQRLIVGGEDHRAELKFEESKSFRALKEYLEYTFTGLDFKVKNRWHGGILEPSDGLPLIGQYAEHEFVTSAFSGNGMTYSAISGKIITDLIMGRGSKYEELYNPKRSMRPKALLHKFRDYGGEFFGGAVKNLFK